MSQLVNAKHPLDPPLSLAFCSSDPPPPPTWCVQLATLPTLPTLPTLQQR